MTPVFAFRLKPVGSPVALHPLLDKIAPVPMVTVLARVVAVPVYTLRVSGVVVMVGPEFTVMVSTLVATSPAASVNLSVKVNVPVKAVVPEMTPVSALRVKPNGRAPDSILQAPVAGIKAVPGVLACSIGVIVVPATIDARGNTVSMVGFATTLMVKS